MAWEKLIWKSWIFLAGPFKGTRHGNGVAHGAVAKAATIVTARISIIDDLTR